MIVLHFYVEIPKNIISDVKHCKFDPYEDTWIRLLLVLFYKVY